MCCPRTHIKHLHRWDIKPREAIALQERLRSRVILRRTFDCVQTVAGADIAFDGDRAIAAVIIYRLSEPLRFFRRGSGAQVPGGMVLYEIERQHVVKHTKYPYIPGLLSFREGPALLDAFAKLKVIPDVVLFDGQGIAHPRGFGLASHIGLCLDIPTIGCAKSRLIGEHKEPGNEVGDWSPLMVPARRNAGSQERIGAVLRTREGVKPIYISIGHRTDLKSAIAIVLATLDRTRIPRPTRDADMVVEALKHGKPFSF